MLQEPTERKDDFQRRVETIRRFNRLYTGRIGLLQKSHLGSGFSLSEARILYELGQRPPMTASEVCAELSLDQGYVSRILAHFQRQGLIDKHVARDDRRAQRIMLSKKGREVCADLDRKQDAAIAELLAGLSESEQKDLTSAAQNFLQVLDPHDPGPVVIRQPRPGDLGWIVHRHGTAIAKEFGWDGIGFETKIAEILGGFGQHPGREQCWVAERDGEILGSVFVMPEDETTARLRVLYVEPAARGLGLGRKLVDLCLSFAREAGYRKMVLWTHSFQKPARKIYDAAGFRLTHEEATQSFGVDVVSETWERDL